jgi:hypothetical protein
MMRRLCDTQKSLRSQLLEAGVRKQLAIAATRLGGEIELTIDDLEEFCRTFTADEIDFIKTIPSDARLLSVENSVRSAHIDLAAIASLLPPTFVFRVSEDLAVDATALANVLRACRRQIATLRKQLKTARGRANPIERYFRLRWNRLATDRTGAPLHVLGATLFNITFGADIDSRSFARMLARDAEALSDAKRVRTAKRTKSL